MSTDKLTRIRVDLLDPNPWQPASRHASDVSALADSISERGVIQPIIVIANGDRYTIVAGERRQRAAKLAGLSEIPAVIVKADDVDQIQNLLAENMQRTDFTTLEEADGLQAALELGVKPAVLAAATGRSAAEIEVAATIAKAPAKSRAKIEGVQTTLDEAAALLEFAGDKDKLERLSRSVGQGDFRHQLEYVRQQREAEAKGKAARKELERAGIPILKETYAANISRLSSLRIEPDAHKDCPGHAATIDLYSGDVIYWCTKARSHGSAGSAGGKLTDEAKAARKAKREGKALWIAATAVRREFVAELTARKQIPVQVLPFASRVAWDHGLTAGKAPQYGTTWEAKRSELVRELVGSSTAAIWRLFAQACAMVESAIESQVESNGVVDPKRTHSALGDYYATLIACGYTPAECEAVAVKAASSESTKRTVTPTGDVSVATDSAPEVESADTFEIPTCRICGCTDEYACDDEGAPCHWVAPDLCSACVPYIPCTVCTYHNEGTTEDCEAEVLDDIVPEGCIRVKRGELVAPDSAVEAGEEPADPAMAAEAAQIAAEIEAENALVADPELGEDDFTHDQAFTHEIRGADNG